LWGGGGWQVCRRVEHTVTQLSSNLLNQGRFAYLPGPGQYLNKLGQLFEAAEQERCLWPLEGLAGAFARLAWAGGFALTRH
jgi:hypothetical protein